MIQRGKCYHSKAVNRKRSRAPLRELGHKHIKLTVPGAPGKPHYTVDGNEVTLDQGASAQEALYVGVRQSPGHSQP